MKTAKRFLAILLAMVLAMGVFAAAASAQDTTECYVAHEEGYWRLEQIRWAAVSGMPWEYRYVQPGKTYDMFKYEFSEWWYATGSRLPGMDKVAEIHDTIGFDAYEQEYLSGYYALVDEYLTREAAAMTRDIINATRAEATSLYAPYYEYPDGDFPAENKANYDQAAAIYDAYRAEHLPAHLEANLAYARVRAQWLAAREQRLADILLGNETAAAPDLSPEDMAIVRQHKAEQARVDYFRMTYNEETEPVHAAVWYGDALRDAVCLRMKASAYKNYLRADADENAYNKLLAIWWAGNTLLNDYWRVMDAYDAGTLDDFVNEREGALLSIADAYWTKEAALELREIVRIIKEENDLLGHLNAIHGDESSEKLELATAIWERYNKEYHEHFSASWSDLGAWKAAAQWSLEMQRSVCEIYCGTCGTDDPPIPAHTHSYTAIVTGPTYDAQGYTTHSCDCGDSYVDSYVEKLAQGNSDTTETPVQNAWYETLPSFVQWIFRWLFFGWLWMR